MVICNTCRAVLYILQGKGYVIGGSLANALLSVTYQMAAVGHRDFLPDAELVRGPAAGAGWLTRSSSSSWGLPDQQQQLGAA